MIAFIVKREPRSFNARSKEQYKKDIEKEFMKNNFKNVPFCCFVYSKIFYFHSEKTSIDADNLSKPIVDALRGKAYYDDNIVILRICGRIDLSNSLITEFNIEHMPESVLKDFLDTSDIEKHFLYIEIGEFSNNMIILGDDNDSRK